MSTECALSVTDLYLNIQMQIGKLKKTGIFNKNSVLNSTCIATVWYVQDY